MRFNALGHASWLLEAGASRLVLDPLLFESHAGGIFEVVPRRRVDPRSLAADFVLVSHAHFDHFDVDSLGALAGVDPDTVVMTSDALVAETCAALGFRTVRVVAPGTRVELADGLTLVTTPSHAPDVEWGTIYSDASGTVWNMVDTVFSRPADAKNVVSLALDGRAPDLTLAPIQTLLEISLATSSSVGFSPEEQHHLMACAAASGSRTFAPSACGEALTGPFDAMNAYVYPVSRERAARDLSRFVPGARVLLPALGEAIVVEGSDAAVAPGSVVVERIGDGRDPRRFRPFDPAPLLDPNLDGRDPGEMRDAIRRFAHEQLAPAIAGSIGEVEALAHAVMVLEVVLPDDRLFFRLESNGGCEERGDPEYDVLDAVAGSMLLDVVEGRRAWVEPLLAGLLRSSIRGVSVREGSAVPLPIAPMFPYYAISYRESVERAVRHRVRRFKEGARRT